MAINKSKIFINNLAYILFSQAIIFTTGFIKIPLYSSFFLTSELGNYSLVISSLNYLDIILLSWIASTFWRFIYENNSQYTKSQLISTFASLLIFLGLLGFAVSIILGIYVFHFNGSLPLFLLGFLSVFLQQATSVFFMILQSENEIKRWSIGLALQSIFSLILFLILCLFWGKDLKNIFISSIILNLFLLSLGFKLFPNLLKESAISWRKQPQLKKIISYTFQSTVVNILLVILINADRFIVSYYKGPSQTGIYSQIYGVAFVGFSFVIQGFTNVLLPYFNKATIKDSEKEVVSNIIKLYITLFTPISIFLILNARYIINLLLSDAYHPYYAIFSWVVAGIYLYGLANFFEIRLKLLNRISIVSLILSLVAAFNIIANNFYLKNFGIEWAGKITFMSYALLFILFLILNFRALIEINIAKELILVLLISFAIISLTLLFHHYFSNITDVFSIFISSFFLFIGYIILYKRQKSLFYFCYDLLKK